MCAIVSSKKILSEVLSSKQNDSVGWSHRTDILVGKLWNPNLGLIPVTVTHLSKEWNFL